MISFNNTEVAFQDKSNRDLNRAYWLFKIIGSPTMVKLGKPLTTFAIKFRLPIKGLIRKTIFKQFCGGETIELCKTKIADLSKSNIGTILDYSVEGKTDDDDFEHTVEEIMATIKAGNGNEKIPFAVFKVSGIARFGLLERMNNTENVLTEKEKHDSVILLERFERICKKAHETGTPVFIDAEETWIQETIDRITYQMMEKYNSERAMIFNTLQIYRHDRLEHLKKQTEIAQEKNYKLGIKLVRGAYMEKERRRANEKKYPSPIQKDKASTDKDFNLALDYMIQNLGLVEFCAGSHNEESNLLLTQLMDKHKVPHDHPGIYFAQLLGMSDHISYNLSDQGFNVAKYVPYGPINEVLPYLLRRADENTSVAGQTSRELGLITLERNRRKLY
jgi:proline dehydrogenase